LKVKSFGSWVAFKKRLEGYTTLTSERRNQIIFRGQASSSWELKATLDRVRQFNSDEQRERCIDTLIRHFKRECSGLTHALLPNDEPVWELLGRHHGLLTPILDWSQSPWVAAYFAFADAMPTKSEFVSIWVLDRDLFARKDVPEVRFIDDDAMIQLNSRAIEQRGLFLRVYTAEKSLDQLLAKSLFRYDIPVSDRRVALADLDEMLVNARVLFRDFDGAAATANQRVLELDGN
jgi:hypothetical protein